MNDSADSKKLGVASGAVGNLVMYRSLVELFGEVNAKILMGQKPGSGKGDKNKKKDDDELKKHPFSYYKEQGVEDAKKDLAKKEGYRETIDYWREKHPDKSDLADELYKKKKPKDEDEQTNGGGNQQPQQTTPRQEERAEDEVDETPKERYTYTRYNAPTIEDVESYIYDMPERDSQTDDSLFNQPMRYYYNDYNKDYNDNYNGLKSFGPTRTRVTSIMTPTKMTSRSKRKR